MKNLFDKQQLDQTLTRLEKLTPDTRPQWGKMNAPQMLAHLNVAYEMTYDGTHPKATGLTKLMLKLFVKKAVVGPKPYKKNGQTAPQFIIKGDRDFAKEKQRLIDYIHKTQSLGASHFENKENISFGPLSSKEWNVLFAKHIDHHFTQFGV